MHCRRLGTLVTLAALGAACGDDTGPLVAAPDAVVRACTSKVYARRPFGLSAAVNRFEIEFEVPDSVNGFVVSAWDRGASTTLSSLHPPSGFAVDLVASDDLERFHPAALATVYGIPVDVDRLMVPPAPSYDYLMEPGTWRVRGDTGGKRFCVSIAATEGGGTELDLAVYVVGVDGLSGGGAQRSADWAEVVDTMQSIFEPAGVTVRADRIVYFDLGQIETTRFSILRSWEDFQALMATSQVPSRAAGGPLRLNVFLIRGFAGDLPRGLLGVASGVPGAAGVHGTHDSGIVFGVEDYIGAAGIGADEFDVTESGNAFLGRVMAHEIGHFIGLFHTTEIRGGVDPLQDTLACPGMTRLETVEALLAVCPDSNNLMFPLALPGGGSELTAGQVETFQANPLLRVARP